MVEKSEKAATVKEQNICIKNKEMLMKKYISAALVAASLVSVSVAQAAYAKQDVAAPARVLVAAYAYAGAEKGSDEFWLSSFSVPYPLIDILQIEKTVNNRTMAERPYFASNQLRVISTEKDGHYTYAVSQRGGQPNERTYVLSCQPAPAAPADMSECRYLLNA